LSAFGKGKLERWHRTLRDGFFSELDAARVHELGDLNARWWAWIETLYHHTPHSGLNGATPLARYQRDLAHIRPLGALAPRLDALFHHRITGKVRKNGTLAYQGERFEVPYALTGRSVVLGVDPPRAQVLGVEDAEGQSRGPATALDVPANATRKRHKPGPEPERSAPLADPLNAVELAYRQYHGLCLDDTSPEKTR